MKYKNITLHCCLFDKECRQFDAPKRLYISTLNWSVNIALSPSAKSQGYSRTKGPNPVEKKFKWVSIHPSLTNRCYYEPVKGWPCRLHKNHKSPHFTNVTKTRSHSIFNDLYIKEGQTLYGPCGYRFVVVDGKVNNWENKKIEKLGKDYIIARGLTTNALMIAVCHNSQDVEDILKESQWAFETKTFS